MVWRRVKLRATVGLVSVIVSKATRAVAAETLPTTAFDSAENKSSSPAKNLWAPFGLYTDDLDAMVKRRNIRALVLINPIGFFHDNGQPMGVMHDVLSALQTYVNQKFKTGALKVEISFIPVRPDQVEAALIQGVGDVVAYALVVTAERQPQVAFHGSLGNNAEQVLNHRAGFRSRNWSRRSWRQEDLRKSPDRPVSAPTAAQCQTEESRKAAHRDQGG